MKILLYIKIIINHFLNIFRYIRYSYLSPPVSKKDVKALYNVNNGVDFIGQHIFCFANEDKEKIRGIYQKDLQQDFVRTIFDADRILENRITFFDLKDHNVGKKINWHFDYSTQKERRRKYYKNINLHEEIHLGDIKYIWEINRFQFVFDLGKAFYLTGDEKYAKKIKNLIEGWIDKNPFKIGVNWFSGLEVGIRSIAWVWAYHFCRGSLSWTNEFKIEFLRQLVLHCEFIVNHFSKRKHSNNHLIGEAACLYYTATFLEKWPQATNWKSKSKEILESEILVQVFPDGGDKEQAFEYHRFVADFFTLAYQSSQNINDKFSVVFENQLINMYQFMFDISTPNGKVPHVGDDDDAWVLKLGMNSGRNFNLPIYAANLLFADKFKYTTNVEKSEEILWMFGIVGWQKKINLKIPDYSSSLLPHSGYAVSRTSWNKNAHYLLFDFGEQGLGSSGHGHADALSFNMQIANTPIFIDSGTYGYTKDLQSRDYFIDSFAHNVAIVDNLSQSQKKAGEPFGWVRKTNGKLNHLFNGNHIDFFDAEHNGYESIGVNVQRKILNLKAEYILILDKFISPDEHQINRLFHLHPAIKYQVENDVIRLANEDKNITINCYYPQSEQLKIIKGQEKPQQGWCSDNYGVMEPSAVLNLASSFSGDKILPFIIDLNDNSKPSASPVFDLINENNINYIKFTKGPISFIIIDNSQSKKATLKGLETDAQFLLIEKVDNTITKVLALNVSLIIWEGSKIFESGSKAENIEFVSGKSTLIATDSPYHFAH